MADFNFSIADLISNDAKPFQREQTKNLPTGQTPKTSSSAQALQTHDLDSPAQLSVLSVGEVMMGTQLFDDPGNVLSKQETMMTNLVGATVNGDPNGKNLGPFSAMVPTDILAQQGAAAAAAPAPAGPSNDPSNPSATSGTPTSGPGAASPNGSQDGKALVANPNVVFQETAGGKLAKQDIIDGKIAPNIIFALSVLAGQIGFTISCGASDLSGHRNQGHAANSLHYQFRAIDIVDLRDLTSGKAIHIANAQQDPLIRKALDVLNTITGPRRPTQVISLINTGYRGFISAADHWNHIHLGTKDWGEPSATAQYAPAPIQLGKLN